ncbi:sensor histidine kinase [Micromonospora sp. NPDC004551]|uniref:sensor histidine kinase n=1 Tax=Micromonospora sp. NPDC004551 TaxID=3154284 RepID=UPI0033A34787
MTDRVARPARTERRPSRAAAPVQGLRLVGAGITEGVAALVVGGAVGLIPLGIGLALLPPTAARLRALANRARSRAAVWSGEAVHESPPWTVDRPGFAGRAVLSLRIITDRAFWGELLWAMLVPYTSGLLAGAPLALIGYGLFGALVQPFLWANIHAFADGNYYAMIHVDSWTNALLAVPLGVAFVALGVWSGPWWLRRHARITRALLASDRTELVRRIEQLTDIRAEVNDASAAELRRIERDLHDGAQARLVAMGMNLDAAERQLRRDPESARALLRQARESSSAALQELRDLVRGIHPPVLADRGLPDAVRAAALDMVVDVAVEATIPARLAPPVEAAAYFAVNEALANAAKHAGAGRITVDLRYDDGRLRIEVSDDGHGGADPSRGTGLRGMSRRLAAFDGTVAVHSPPGGPTTIRMEIPCALSSPKTSSS